MNNYHMLEKQIIYLVNKLKNSQYFDFNKTYKKTLNKYNVEIKQENNKMIYKLYNKFTNKFLFSKTLD